MKKYSPLILSIGIALVAGIAGGLLGFLGGGYFAASTSYGDVLLPAGQLGQKEVIIKEAKKVVVEQDVRIEQLALQVDKSVFGVFRKKAGAKTLWEQLYGPDEYIAPAVAITSDGWMISWHSGDITAKSAVVVKGSDVYEIDQVVADPATKVKYLHIKNLAPQVVEFAQRETLKAGQTLVGVDSVWGSIEIAHIGDLHDRVLVKKTDFIQSIENYDERLQLLSTDALTPGLPLFNLNGELVALSQQENRGLKISYINALMNGVLKNKAIEKPYLGIFYMELAKIPGVPAGSQGVMVVKNPQGIAVRSDSPLVKSLQEGDVILGIEGSRISKDISFADLVFDYKPGSTVNFKVLRQGKEFTLEKVIGVK